MNLRLIIYIFICSSFLCGCSDHQTGYREGYSGSKQKQWVVIGKGDYQKGYLSGQAERFQDDWLAENPVEESLLHCPAVVVKADPLLFLPAEYKRITTDIYQR